MALGAGGRDLRESLEALGVQTAYSDNDVGGAATTETFPDGTPDTQSQGAHKAEGGAPVRSDEEGLEKKGEHAAGVAAAATDDVDVETKTAGPEKTGTSILQNDAPTGAEEKAAYIKMGKDMRYAISLPNLSTLALA